jgi:RimJ/RimL family protein N-acetyltransferase
MNLICACHLASNTSSARVLSKVGMVQEGRLREFARKDDDFHDMVMMALLRMEWPPAQKLDRPGASIARQKALA